MLNKSSINIIATIMFGLLCYNCDASDAKLTWISDKGINGLSAEIVLLDCQWYDIVSRPDMYGGLPYLHSHTIYDAIKIGDIYNPLEFEFDSFAATNVHIYNINTSETLPYLIPIDTLYKASFNTYGYGDKVIELYDPVLGGYDSHPIHYRFDLNTISIDATDAVNAPGSPYQGFNTIWNGHDLVTASDTGHWIWGDATSSVPEPSTFLLLGAGLGGIALLKRKSRKQ